MKVNHGQRRAGFTMIELLVVITILLILSVLAIAIFSGRNSDRTRSAARIAQSAFLGAKDRALHAKDLRGVRMVRDTTDNTLVTALIYLQPLPLQETGNFKNQPPTLDFALSRPNYLTTGNTDATQVVISGPQAAAWFGQDSAGIWPSNRVQIRIPSEQSSTGAGVWYNLAPQNNSPPYWGTMSAGNLILNLQTPFNGGKSPLSVTHNAIDPPDANASCDIQLGNDVLPFHAPISLPSNIVIDLKFCSSNVQTLAGVGSGNTPYVDLMFSPRGMLTGYIAALGPLHFLLRDLQDAADTTVNPYAVGAPGSANPDRNKGERLILTVFPQTGLVSTFELDPTDAVNNATGAAGADGLADNAFNLAQQGKSAGR
jgi:prepilin-type N-terminal cleavage/methylation domain-containing protein